VAQAGLRLCSFASAFAQPSTPSRGRFIGGRVAPRLFGPHASNRPLCQNVFAESQTLVTITESTSKSTHVVTITATERAKYTPTATPEALLRASFEFLLEREPKESIMRQFSLSTIESYFPDYPTEIRARL
jgi:hypothetical protein